MYHVVWSTKYRKRALEEVWIQEYCEQILRRAATEYGMFIHTLEVDPNHVHLHIEIPPQRSVGSAVRILKSISARLVFKRFGYLKKKLWAGELWNDGYFVRTVGDEVTASIVERYIREHAEKGLEPAQGELFAKHRSQEKSRKLSRSQ
jgi:putative transposase